MKIELGDDWYLRSDEYQWIVSRKEIHRKDGRTGYQQSFYFPTLQGAMDYLLHRKIRESDAQSFRDLKRNFDEISRDLIRRVQFGSVDWGKHPYETA